MAPRYTRRAFLTGVAGSSLGLAGCSSGGTVQGPTSPTFESLVSGVSVGSRDVVIELASSDVTEVVLIAPDGTAFDSQQIQTGVRTVRFQIIELDSEFGTSSHYSPGMYEIVVVANDTEFKRELSIVPDIRLTGIRQYREGDSPSDLARIVFTVKNVGTGPTWIYDASFQDAPNYTANNELVDDPSIPYVELPTSEGEFIVASGETQSYINTSNPLAFPETESSCEQQSKSFVIQIGVADGSLIETNLTPICGGDKIALSLIDRVVYTQTGIEWEGFERGN